MKTTKLLCVIVLALVASFRVAAQSALNVIDEVIWVVGDEAILRSDVEKARAMGDRIQGNPYCVIPERLAIQKLFIHQAQADSVEVTSDQVASMVEEQLNEWIQMATSREKLEEYRGMSITQIREELTEQFRNMQLTRMMRNRLTEDIKVTPAEVRYYFRDMPEDSLPLIPTQVEVEIVADHPRFRQEEIDRIKTTLREYTDRVNSGESSFAMLAKMYSEDKESARQGGEMDYMGRMELDPAFANVAWSLSDPKKVSKIVESQFGYHIIQLVDKRGDKLKLRHILLRPHVEQADIDACIMRLDSIAADIRDGRFSFEDAASELSDDKDSRANRGLMTNVTRDENTGDYIRTSRFKMGELPTEIARVVETLDVGEVSKAFLMMDKSGKEQCVIVKLKSRIKAHPATITEDFQVLANIVRERRCDEFIDNWIREKQRTTYVRINPEWLTDCEFQYPGWVKE